jgi:hypothetical protein
MHGPQALDDAEADPAAAVHGDAGRLVDHDEIAILVNDGGSDELAQRLGWGLGGLRILLTPASCSGGNLTLSPATNLIGRLGASAVYPHLAGSQDAVDQAAGTRPAYAAGSCRDVAVIPFLRLDVTDWQMRVTY